MVSHALQLRAGLCVVLLSIGAACFAQSADDSFAAASAAFAREDFAAALSGFEAARAAGMSGPALDYNIAVCHYKLGQYSQAEAAFASVSAQYPNMRALAVYNRGLALLQLERSAQARTAFEQASASQDGSVAALARAMLQRMSGAAAPAVSEWFKYVDLGLGHDDNVALLEQGNLPVGLSSDSPFTEIFAQLSGPAGATWQFDASAYLVSYADANEFDQHVLRFAANRHSVWRRWDVEAGPYLSRSALDGDGFEQRLGGAVQFGRGTAAGATLLLQLGYESIDELESRFAFVDGTRAYLRAGLSLPIATGGISFDYRYESNDRDSANVSPDRHGVALRYRRRFSARWSGEAGYRYRDSDYRVAPRSRSERLSSLHVAAARDLASGWQLLTRYETSDNDSNDPVFSYRRHRVSVSIGKVF